MLKPFKKLAWSEQQLLPVSLLEEGGRVQWAGEAAIERNSSGEENFEVDPNEELNVLKN